MKHTDADLASFWETILNQPESFAQIAEIEDRYPLKRCVEIPFDSMVNESDDCAEYTLVHPDESIRQGVSALSKLVSKADVGIRITGLPGDAAVDISKLRSEHLGKLIRISGLVRKATKVCPNIKMAKFKCARCPATIIEPQDTMTLTEPLECYKEQEGCGRTSGSTKFKLVAEESYTTDIQKIEIQENPEGLRGGTQPGRITAYLSHEITGRIQPGMRVTLNGILRMKVDDSRTKSTISETELEVISFEMEDGDIDDKKLTEDDVEEIKKISKDPDLIGNFVRSIAPGIQGYELEKESMLYQLVGGVSKELDDGQKLRGDIHILLVGDPGVAKSQLIRYMTDLAPRGVYASGKSSSAAGLTAAATKDDFGEGRWVLEAGALVLADKGLAGIDELDKMSDQDRSALHEAMEAQQITVAKAGITATLQCRFSMLAGANPKFGRFDTMEPIAGQIDLPPTLLSRFDLIYAIMDKPNSSKDRAIAGHVLRAHMRAGALKHQYDNDEVANQILSETENLKPKYDQETVRKYVSYARGLSPIITPDAEGIIIEHYLKIRKLGEGENSTVPITARQLEAYVRLTEASAKMRLSKYATGTDAKRAIEIVQYYLNKISLDDGEPDIDRLMTGTSRKQRDKLKAVLGVIRNMGKISETDLIAECESKQIDNMAVEEALKKLKESGQIYEPRCGIYQASMA
mgnify:FL=1